MSIRFLVLGGITIDTLIGLGSNGESIKGQASRGQNMVGDSRQSGTVVCGGNAIYAGVGAAIWADQPSDVGLVACLGIGYPGSWIDALRATVSATFVIESVGALPTLEALPVLRQEAPTRLEQLRRLIHGRLSGGSLGTTA